MLTTSSISQTRMDALADGHFRGEEAGDVEAVVGASRPTPSTTSPAGLAPLCTATRRSTPSTAACSRGCASPPRARAALYGDRHLVDESILHAHAIGRPFGMEGRGRPVSVRMLHVFDFAEDRIARESAWLDLATLSAQLAPDA